MFEEVQAFLESIFPLQEAPMLEASYFEHWRQVQDLSDLLLKLRDWAECFLHSHVDVARLFEFSRDYWDQ